MVFAVVELPRSDRPTLRNSSNFDQALDDWAADLQIVPKTNRIDQALERLATVTTCDDDSNPTALMSARSGNDVDPVDPEALVEHGGSEAHGHDQDLERGGSEDEDGEMTWLTQEERTQGSVTPKPNGTASRPPQQLSLQEDEGPDNIEDSESDFGALQQADDAPESSNDDTASSIPDDSPSQSLTASPSRRYRSASAQLSPSNAASPTPSLRPFDRRFKARLSSSSSILLSSPRASSPAFLNSHSRQSSLSSQIIPLPSEGGSTVDENISSAPWDVIRWTRLKKLTGQAFSEVAKAKFGRSTCLTASALIAIGTNRGLILAFDHQQNLKAIIGVGNKAVEAAGPVTSIAISADHSTVAGGHKDGSIFTWEVHKPSQPFLHIPSIDVSLLHMSNVDGHARGSASVIHVGFLGTRHTALVSADDRGMAFSHLATRGLGSVARTVKTTRILGRYPDPPRAPPPAKPRKPSSVLAFSPLPLGSAEQATDGMGVVAMLTPYLLVIVSTTPIAQTQFKSPRPKEVLAHGAMSGCLAFFPSVKLRTSTKPTLDQSPPSSLPKLVYCWSNVLTILDIKIREPSDPVEKERPPILEFRPRSRWKAEEAIVAVQWVSRSVLAVLTITHQLSIIEDGATMLVVTDTFDLMQRQIFHQDLFSNQLASLVETLDEEDQSMHGVVADAFYASFRAYKGRLFLLGINDLSMGTLSNWADRLVALMENGDYIAAVRQATGYYTGVGEKLTVGLPEDDELRHSIVQDRLFEMMTASLKFALQSPTANGSRGADEDEEELDHSRAEALVKACFDACLSMDAFDFLLDNVFEAFEDAGQSSVFVETLEGYIVAEEIQSVPAPVFKSLINHFKANSWDGRLEEMVCHMDTSTMDLDQVTSLCKQHHLYDAFIYVWNQALDDYIAPLVELFRLIKATLDPRIGTTNGDIDLSGAQKIFPYLSYILTGRVYPTGDEISESRSMRAKADLYHLLFSGKIVSWPKDGGRPISTLPRDQGAQEGEEPPFPYLRLILRYDAASLMSVLNEAFEDAFLNGAAGDQPMRVLTKDGPLTDEQIFGLSVNRQYILSILLEVMSDGSFISEDTVYLDMFIARNLPKFPQFILLSGTALRKVFIGLCSYPTSMSSEGATDGVVADDCQLSVEYLLSVHRPPDLDTLLPLFRKAGFFRVLKSIYKAEKQYAKLIATFFEDTSGEEQEKIFDAVEDCLRPGASLTTAQKETVRDVIRQKAECFIEIDPAKAASTVERYAPDLHQDLLAALEHEEDDDDDDDDAGDARSHNAQRLEYLYLGAILDPQSPTLDAQGSSTAAALSSQPTPSRRAQTLFTTRYVRLLCKFAPSEVSDFVGRVQSSSDLRLEEVLPAMERSGVVDAAVVLMARQGKVQQAMDRLVKHLKMLEEVVLGLLEGGTKGEAEVDGVLGDIDRFAKVGVWLCRGEGKALSASSDHPSTHIASTRKSRKQHYDLNRPLTPLETLWHMLLTTLLTTALTLPPPYSDHLHPTILYAFSALLSLPLGTPHLSFLPLFHSLLTSLPSHFSLAHLRATLTQILSSYTYESSILSLARNLLDADLYTRLESARRERARGWRPRSQVCEACGRRVWGQGAGAGVWDAWELRHRRERSDIDNENDGRGDTYSATATAAARRRAGARGTASNRGSGKLEKGKGAATSAASSVGRSGIVGRYNEDARTLQSSTSTLMPGSSGNGAVAAAQGRSSATGREDIAETSNSSSSLTFGTAAASTTAALRKRLEPGNLSPGKGAAAADDDVGNDQHHDKALARLVPSEASKAASDGPASPIVVFSCRHVYHQRCLERLRAGNGGGGDDDFDGENRPWECIICSK